MARLSNTEQGVFHLWRCQSYPHLDLNRSAYVLYGVKHIDLVALLCSSQAAGAAERALRQAL